jgi:hypothetical protein
MSVRNSLLLTFAVLVTGAPGLRAQTAAAPPRAVLELFTSQGCSSCPAADALFVEFARDPALVTLTFPVTYWDYLGWKDTLGQDGFTKRQKLYAKARGDGQVYTPQAIVNGHDHVVGSDRKALDETVSEQAVAGFPVGVALRQATGALSVTLSPASATASAPAAGVWILTLSRSVTVPIERGENSGKTVTYANVVRGITRIGEWTGETATLTVPLETVRRPQADAYVVIVQTDLSKRGGVVLGATRIAALP